MFRCKWRTSLGVLSGFALLAGCSPSGNSKSAVEGGAPSERSANAIQPPPSESSQRPTRVADAERSSSSAAPPFLAVNTRDALLPLGRTRGLVSVQNGCITFRVGGQLYTPVWPVGTRLSADGERVIGPGGEQFPIGADATLDGASFSLANESMRLREPLPRNCPGATYAVNL
jgi:hypothetical protein